MDTILLQDFKPSTLKCLIVDDEYLAIKGVVNFIKQLDFLEASYTCTSAIAAMEILKTEQIDLMFLDINMPVLSGLEFLESLDNPPLTILTTAYSEFALEGYRLNVVDYLLKPLEFKRFFQATNKAYNLYLSSISIVEKEIVNEVQTEIFLKQGDSFHRVLVHDILYIEGMQNYVKLHFNDKNYVIHQTMTSLEAMLPFDTFFRIHISYLVNMKRIDAIVGSKVVIGVRELPVSRYRKESLLKKVVYDKLINKP